MAVQVQITFLMQMQSDIIYSTGQPSACAWKRLRWELLILPVLPLATGRTRKMCLKNQAIDRTFTPEITPEESASKIKLWKKAVTYAFNWAKED